jgi:hypothetical protein
LGLGSGKPGDEGACGSKSAHGAEAGSGRKLQVGNHHLKLYSEIVDVSLDEPASGRLCVPAARI